MNPFRAVGGSAVMLARSAMGRGVERRELWRQSFEIGNRSAWLVLSAMAFLGAVLVTIGHAQAKRFVGNVALLGPPYFQLLVREMGPLAAAILVAARYGASSSAELAAMTVNEQIDALEVCAGDPIRDLVAPRVLAGVLMLPVMTCLGTAMAAISAAATAQYGFNVDGSAFLDPRYVTPADLFAALGKSIACGAWIAAVSAWAGLSARGGASSVGEHTTDGVVAACLGCMVIDFLFGIGFHLVRL